MCMGYNMSDEMKNNDNFVDASVLDEVPIAPVPPKDAADTFTSGVNYGAPTQPAYQQPVYQQAPIPKKLEEPVGIGTWLGILFLMMIPCVNIIMLFVLAFGEGKESRKNFSKACLIFMLIWIVISFVLTVLLGTALFAFLAEIGSLY